MPAQPPVDPPQTSDEVWHVVTTVASVEDAHRLAGALMSRRLAACVQVEMPIRSFYVWENELHDDEEFRLTMKTTRGRFSELRDYLLESHPYDLPEILALPAIDGHPAYLAWVAQEVAPANDGGEPSSY